MKGNKLHKWCLWIVILLAVLSVTVVFSLSIGTTNIPVRDLINVFISPDETSANYSIVFDIRLPRIILGFAVGSALSIAGVMLQGMFRNPLVEPYTLGISGGAALGVCINIAFGFSRTIGIICVPLAGFIGAGLVVGFVYLLSMRKGVLKMHGLLLSGVMVSFICSSLFMLIMAVMRIEDLHGIIFWTMGSLEQPSWLLIQVMFIASVAGLAAAYLFAKDLNAFSLGDEHAAHLGINTEKTKRMLFFITSVLTGLSVSVAGIIGFVGLVMPHFMRLLVGWDNRILLISSFLAGGIFVIASDTLSRTIISPLELPVGVITGVVGGTVFVYTLNRDKSGR